MIAKRAFDIVVAWLGLILLLPVLLGIALVIQLDSPGPVFFRQERIGRGGRPFRIHKFRTMEVDADRQGPPITVGADVRVTASGQWLRRHKLDELPQLIDVLVGDMSLVGPRPEVPRYVACYPPGVREAVLSVRPGITDLASIEFRQEADLLAIADDPERAYIEKILPIKTAYYERYVRERTFFGDVAIIVKTIRAVFIPMA
jgi:lipopolysaccharide/colanic/teichoic acid biosynthesis glycosyltransferase